MIDPAASLGRDVLFAIQMTEFFSGLPEPEVRALLAGATLAEAEQGTVLITPGSPADTLFILLSGLVELTVSEPGRAAVVEVVRGPAVLGEAALFDQTHPMGARALGPCRLVAIPAEPFLAALQPRFDLVLKMLGSLSMRLRMLVRQIAELKLKTTAQRLGGFLLALAEPGAEGAATVRFPFDKRLAAASLGMTPESLSRALSRLGPVGVKGLPDNVVAIQDLDALRAFCAEES